MRTLTRLVAIVAGSLVITACALAASPATEIYLAEVGSNLRSDVWITNVSALPVTFMFQFLQSGQANVSPAFFEDTLSPGETRMYADVASTRLHLSNVDGAARILADGELFISERIQLGQFAAGLPKSFSISLGQSASLESANLELRVTSPESRGAYIIETSGAASGVHLEAFDDQGSRLGSEEIALQPYEQLPLSAGSIASAGSGVTRLVATVTSGLGTVLLAGKQAALVPLAKPGFEQVLDKLLSSSGGSGVSSLNSLTGALTLTPGSGISITPSGSSIQIAATGGGGGGSLTLPFTGSASQPTGGVFSVTNSVAAASGASNSAITGIGGAPSGFVAQTAGTGSYGVIGDSLAGTGVSGFSLHGAGTQGLSGSVGVYGAHVPAISGGQGFGVIGLSLSSGGIGVFGSQIANAPDSSNLIAGVVGTAGDNPGVIGRSSTNSGVEGISDATNTNFAGVFGSSTVSNNKGFLGGPDYGVKGTSGAGNAIFGLTFAGGAAGVQGENGPNHTDGYLGGFNYGVFGHSDGAGMSGVLGVTGNPSYTPVNSGVFGVGDADNGVFGQSNSAAGTFGGSTKSHGVYGNTSAGGFIAGVFGITGSGGIGVYGSSAAGGAYAVYGNSHGAGYAGFFDGNVNINGALTVTNGSYKSFVDPHPTDPSKEIRYICLEGGEAGTYFRGSARISNGISTIEVPEDFRSVSSEKSLTVQATPVGAPAVLYCVKKGLDRIVIQGSSDVDFDFIVHGIRKGSEEFRAIEPNEHYVPRFADDRNFAARMNPRTLTTLKANGILNPDGSINLETAQRLGWDQRPGWHESKLKSEARIQ